MHTNRVSHQRNVIRLHSYIEYFTRNFLLFPPRFVLPPTIPMMKIFRKARPHARLKCGTSINAWRVLPSVVTKDQGICHGLKAGNFISLNFENRTPIQRVPPVLQGCNFTPTMGKSWPIRGREICPHQEVFIRLIIVRSYFSWPGGSDSFRGPSISSARPIFKERDFAYKISI